MASPQDRAWSEGHKAGSHDQPIGSCPYGNGMMQQKWHQGWREGQKAKDAKDT